MLAAAVAIAGPRGGRTSVTTEARALSLVVAVDISRSMLAEDVEPSRLGRAKREARRLVQDLDGDRLGLLAFAGRSYILTPLTVDGGAISLYLDGLDPDLASEGGTDLAATLNQGLELLQASTEISDRVLVVFTDGETHDSMSDVESAARAIRKAGVRLILVGEGTPTPVKIPIRDASGQLIEYKLDQDGQVVETRLMESVLRATAEAAGGTVVPASLTDQAGAVRELVAAFKRSPSTESRAADLRPMAWVPLLVAALLLLGQTLLKRGAALLAIALLVSLPAAARAQRPSAGERALSSGNPAGAAGAFLRDATRREPARHRLLQRRHRRAPRRRPQGGAPRADRGGAHHRPRTPVPRALQPRGRRPARRPGRLRPPGHAARRGGDPPAGGAAPRAEIGARQVESRAGGADAAASPALGRRAEAAAAASGQQPKPPDQAKPQNRGLTREQAEQILNSVEREERATRNRQLDRLSGGTGGAKDW